MGQRLERSQAGGKYYTTLSTLSPAGDELTLDFAKALITHEQLGQDDIPDYLGISFSSTDYFGHMFGPSSLETEDNILRLDRSLADLFAFVDKQIGLENTLIVLAADQQYSIISIRTDRATSISFLSRTGSSTTLTASG